MNRQQPMNSVNRKFSISLLKLNQINQSQRDDLYEFNAPKYFDLSTLPESPVGNDNNHSDLNIDPWFLFNHSDRANQIKSLKYPRKKKYEQYKRESTIDDCSRCCDWDLDCDYKKEKKTKPSESVRRGKSMINSIDNMTVSKERINNFKRSQSISKGFNSIKKLKRGVSTDTYTYYNNKTIKEEKEKENIEGNKKTCNSITAKLKKITYCPRIHDAKLMKKWEDMKGLKWYNLSPESRAKANDEITQMLKTNAFD